MKGLFQDSALVYLGIVSLIVLGGVVLKLYGKFISKIL